MQCGKEGWIGRKVNLGLGYVFGGSGGEWAQGGLIGGSKGGGHRGGKVVSHHWDWGGRGGKLGLNFEGW